MRNLLLASLLAAAAAAAAQPAPWPRAVLDFASPAEITRVAAAFPNSANMQRRRIAAALDAHDAAAALDASPRLAAMGATLSPASRARIAGLVGEAPVAALAARFEANGKPLGASSAYATLGNDQRLIEGLIWEPRTRRLYATSVVGRRLVEVRPDGAHPVLEHVGSFFAGAADPTRPLLWISSAAIEQTPAGARFTGLIGVDPAHPAAALRIAAPAGATPGDVAVGADGIVYVSDGMNGAVYRCRPGCAALETWLPAGTFRSAQGMALSADGRLLYVADYRYGLAVVERATGRVKRINAPRDLMLDGIDGLVRDHGRLIVIQNGSPPVRIAALALSVDGFGVTGLSVLERANPAWDEPSLGALIGDRLVYVSNPQWERYGAGGTVTGEGPIQPTVIRALRLPAAPRRALHR